MAETRRASGGLFGFGQGMPMPNPKGSVDDHGFWEAVKEHRLVIQQCDRCGEFRHTPVPVCSSCNSFDWHWEESRGFGTLFTYTVIHSPNHPAVRETVPFNIALVTLDDCGRAKITCNLVGADGTKLPHDQIKIGMPLEVCFEETTPEVTQVRFRPRRT